MAVPVDLVSRILTELWAYPFHSNEEQIVISQPAISFPDSGRPS